MALIVLMEDDAATRMLVSSVLRREGHEVLAAEDGQQGVALVEARKPDLIVSDVQMPGLNGFQVLAALRAQPIFATTPVILLTSLQERAHMRIGMTSGADDYITKPFQPRELREAVAAQLNRRKVQAALQTIAVERAVRSAVASERDRLMELYEDRLASELSDRWPAAQPGESDERFESATVLFVDIPNYAALAGKLSTAEMSELVRRLYERANDAAYLFGAHYMQFVGEGLLAVFTGDMNTDTVNHGLRAVRTALALVEAATPIGRYLEETYPGRGLAPFGVCVALNTGPVALAFLSDPLTGNRQRLPVGEVTSTTMQLQKRAALEGWEVAASVSTLRSVTGAVRTGRRSIFDVPGRPAIDAAEITGLEL
ncbi:MAG TPA: response regulator [Ramlibacter sp.]|uniref:response regulator n=1 Tax=Ramlibacter sp. TaxID=1917967 RepID=UPI002C2A62B7|nr:response regulator [Ramlibacter sp.]HVZ46224.1 response regulator [Ramlibacter sp.]